MENEVSSGEVERALRTEGHRIFPYRRDPDSGVRIQENYKDNAVTVTILFRDKPPMKATKLLTERGWNADGDQAYTKQIDWPNRSQIRDEVRTDYLNALNAVREQIGLPPRENYFLSRCS